MTPRAIDWQSIHAKLRRIRGLLDQLAALGPIDADRLADEPVTALAVERILTLLVDLAFSCNSHISASVLGHAPDSYRESFDLAHQAGMITKDLATRLRPSAGMRNVLVHQYIEADQTQVAAAVPLAVEQYGEYVRQVAAFAADRAT